MAAPKRDQNRSGDARGSAFSDCRSPGCDTSSRTDGQRRSRDGPSCALRYHRSRSDKAWTEGVNRWLPNDVAVRWVAHPGTEFDARFSAQSRTYRYLLFVDPFVNPFIESAALREHRALDPVLMNESAQYLVGEHDFTSFRAAHCQSKSAMRRVTSILVGEHQGFIHIEVSANAFLYHMVRNIVGALRLVGARKRSPEWMGDLLRAKDRHQAGRMAPAHGLYLEHVGYDPSYRLPATMGHTPFGQLFDRSP